MRRVTGASELSEDRPRTEIMWYISSIVISHHRDLLRCRDQQPNKLSHF